jgi:hypothetical protein
MGEIYNNICTFRVESGLQSESLVEEAVKWSPRSGGSREQLRHPPRSRPCEPKRMHHARGWCRAD